MTRLTTLDFPHFTRSSIGFDRLFDEINREFANSKSSGYGSVAGQRDCDP